MNELEQLQKEVSELKARNARVELDKAWETSLFRKALVVVLTYIVVMIYLVSMDFPRPFLSSIVPTVGFVLSTVTVGVVKRWWVVRNTVGNKGNSYINP